jgi:hypothetical protein
MSSCDELPPRLTRIRSAWQANTHDALRLLVAALPVWLPRTD